MSYLKKLEDAEQEFTAWLKNDALQFQRRVVRDRAHGGFHERISMAGEPIRLPRRARVSARQLYVYSKLCRMGFQAESKELAAVAKDFLFERHILTDGSVVASVDEQGAVIDGDFRLYDYAFILFAIAAAVGVTLDKDEAESIALAVLGRLERGWRHPVAGFEEAAPRSLPLRANPHMHLLEASLEMLEAGVAEHRFGPLADEIAELCLANFIDPRTGAVRELLDGDWRIDDQSPENFVEPGHQFEWGWLLIRWGTKKERADAISAGEAMIELAETSGKNSNGLVAKSLTSSLEIADPTARLWPHTERIKAWAIQAQRANGDRKSEMAERLVSAINDLFLFFDHPQRGAWWENISDTGKPLTDPARTSSMYHIVGAYAAVRELLSAAEN